MSKMVKLDDEVRAVLLRAEITATSVRLPEQLDRALYVRVDKVLGAAGGKWNRKAKAHVFTTFDPRTMLADVGTAAGIENRQQILQQFPTPPAVADRLVELADVLPEHDVLEPSAGTGAIADALRAAGVRQPVLVEIDEHLVADLRARGYERVLQLDFMLIDRPDECGYGRGFDRIIMNPPFRNRQDITHVSHAFGMLKPGGVLVAVMSPSIDFRSTHAHESFRGLLSEHGEIIERLPRGTFEDTEIETLVVRLQRT